jgi:NAD(P)-dependent dehydrogenase (short-subunit alcohol dehydrogenase family)
VVIAQTYPFNPLYEGKFRSPNGPTAAGITNRFNSEHRVFVDVELRGQGRFRRDGAYAALSRTDWEIAFQELTFAIRIIRAFEGVVYRQEKLHLLEETVRLNQQSADRVAKLVQSGGKLRGADLILARTEVDDSRAQLGQGRAALVTGGTRGVGRATSLALARAGTSVLACYRSDDVAAATLCAEPDWDPARCHVVRADLSTDDGRHAVIAAAVAHFGGLDVLVNNFGSYHPAPLHAIAPRDLAESLFTNLTAHLLLTQAALPVLRDGGAVVTIGAGMAERGRPGHTHFTAAKAGLVGFTLSLAKELAPRRIRVNTVAPGVVETERGIDLPPAVRDAILSAIPLRRFVTSADVANTVVFLAGELAGALDGATVNVDGGI